MTLVRRPQWAILVVQILLAVGLVMDALNSTTRSADRTPDPLLWTCLLVAAAVPAISWPWPWPSFLATLAAVVLFVARGYPGGPIFLPLALAAAVLAWRRPRREGVVAAAVAGPALMIAHAVGGEELMPALLAYPAWILVAVLAAQSVRSTIERRRAAEHARQDRQARERDEERLRLARDLHDGMAHALTVITVQAAAADRLWDRDPTLARDALHTIRASGKAALIELNSVLDLLRDPELPAPRDPTGAELESLVEGVRRTGAEVTFRDSGRPPHESVVYRVVQEALTNAQRHSPGQPITVEVTGNGRAGSVRIHNSPATADGACADGAPARPGTGRGLEGMRERVEASGGLLETGPLPDGGFAVTARWIDGSDA